MIFLLALLATQLQAGMVREIVSNNKKSQDIYLCLGRSTILRFESKPQKIVAGNKNYFNFDFVKNDVTIQPLARVTSNLFVYTQNSSFAFNLRFLKDCRSDDLIKVSRSRQKNIFQGIAFNLGSLKVLVLPGIKNALSPNVGIIDLSVLNHGSQNVALKGLKMALLQSRHEAIWGKDFLAPKQSTRGRIVFDKSKKLGLILTFEWGKHHRKINLPWGHE